MWMRVEATGRVEIEGPACPSTPIYDGAQDLQGRGCAVCRKPACAWKRRSTAATMARHVPAPPTPQIVAWARPFVNQTR